MCEKLASEAVKEFRKVWTTFEYPIPDPELVALGIAKEFNLDENETERLCELADEFTLYG